MPNEWFVTRAGKELGPFSGAQLKQMAASGSLRPDDKVRRDDMSVVRPAGEVKGLFPTPADPAHPQAITTASPVTAREADRTGPPVEHAAGPAVGAAAPVWWHPALIVASLVVCFPVGLVLVWLRPVWSPGKRLAWTGGTLAVWVPVIVLSQMEARKKREEVAAAHRQWEAGDKAAAVQTYREAVRYTGVVEDKDRPTVYGRLIDFEAEGGHPAEVKRWLEDADRKGVTPAVDTTAGKQAVAERRAEVARAEADRKEKESKAEADKKDRRGKAGAGDKGRNRITLAEGRVSADELIAYLKRVEKLVLHTPKEGADGAGTPLDFTAEVGEPCRVHAGRREEIGETVFVFLGETVKDKQIALVMLGTPFDLSQPVARGNDLDPLIGFVGSVLPEADIRKMIRDGTAQLAYGKAVTANHGKATVTVAVNKLKKEFVVTITAKR